jgi:hypothetical protein
MTASVVYWSDFLVTVSEVPLSIPGAVGLERGTLILVGITEDLLE